MSEGGDHRKDLDRTIIRCGGRDYQASSLLGGGLMALAGGVLAAVGTQWQPGYVLGAVTAAVGLGIAWAGNTN